MDGAATRRHGAWGFCRPATKARTRRIFPHEIRTAAENAAIHRTGSHRAGRRGGSPVAPGLCRAGRRHRRTLSPRRSFARAGCKIHWLRRRCNRDGPQLAEQVHLHFQRRLVRLMLALLPLGDPFAEVARMLAIERRLHRRGERIGMRALDDHPRPSHRLQQCPMATDARDEREHDDDTAQSGNYAGHAFARIRDDLHCQLSFATSGRSRLNIQSPALPRASARAYCFGAAGAGAGLRGCFGSRFAASSSSVIFDATPSAGTSAFALHMIAFSTSLRWFSLPQPLW